MPQPKIVSKAPQPYKGEERRYYDDGEVREKWSDEEREDFHRNFKRMKPYLARYEAERSQAHDEDRKRKSKTHLLPLLDD